MDTSESQAQRWQAAEALLLRAIEILDDAYRAHLAACPQAVMG